MQTRATLALCPCICAIYNFEKYCVVLFFFSVLKVIYKVFFLAVYPPPPLPKKSSLQGANQHSSVYWGGQRGGGGREASPLTKVHQNGWFGHEKQCRETGLNFICTTHRKRKIEKKKESAWKMKLRYKLKLEGCFFVGFFFF